MTHWTQELYVEMADDYAITLEQIADQADGEVDDVLDTLGDDYGLDPGSVLDVACGIGRHAVALAERSVDVDGVDISPGLLDRARDRAAEAGVTDRVRFVEGDMRDLSDADLREEYDLVTCLFSSFGFFDDETNREVLAGMADRVAPGGALVMDVANKELMLSEFRESEAAEFGDYLVTEQREYDPMTSRTKSTRRMFKESDGEYEFAAEGSLSIRLYAPVELRKLFEDVGLDADFYGGKSGEQLTRRSPSVFVVARP